MDEGRNRNTALIRALAAPVLALALMGAAATGYAQTAGSMSATGAQHGMGGESGMMAARMGGRMEGPMGGRMLDSVGATADQKARVQAIMKAARDDLAGQRGAHRALRQQMAALMAAPVIDARAVEALRQQMLAQHDATSKRMVQAMLDASAVLTPEQRQQIAARAQQRSEMMQRHMRERRAMNGPAS